MNESGFFNVLKTAMEMYESGGSDPTNRVAVGGRGDELTWTQYKENLENGGILATAVKETALTLGTAPMYGDTGLFGLCGPDEVIGLSVGDDPLAKWLGWFPERNHEKFIKGWTYFDQSGTAAGSVSGSVYGAPCDDPPQSEKMTCEFNIGAFGTYRGCGEPLNLADVGTRKCDKQPTYTLPIEGVGRVRIDNDLVLETIAAAQLVKHEISRHLITGDASTAYQFNGLQNVVKTGYTDINTSNRCTAMDSWVLDWSNDDLDGDVNGYGDIIGVVKQMWRNIRWRISQASVGMPREGDVVLVMPYWLAREFLDQYAWYALRAGAQYEEVFRDNIATRQFRDQFDKGMYNGGHIVIDNFRIHIIEHDWLPIDQVAPNFCSDIYLLTRSLGGQRVLNGQFVPVDMGADAFAKQAGYKYFNVETMQGGRALKWVKLDNACAQPCLLMRPRIYCETPWVQGKIENVCIDAGAWNPMSANPQSNYFLETNKFAASNITQYWYDVDEGDWFQ